MYVPVMIPVVKSIGAAIAVAARTAVTKIVRFNTFSSGHGYPGNVRPAGSF
jgi:hypothetical protein